MEDDKYMKGGVFETELKRIATKCVSDEVFDYINCLKQYLARLTSDASSYPAASQPLTKLSI